VEQVLGSCSSGPAGGGAVKSSSKQLAEFQHVCALKDAADGVKVQDK